MNRLNNMGVLAYSGRPMRKGSRHPINLGDPIQSYAAENALRTIGYNGEIQLLEKYSLASFKGEKVKLIFNSFNMIVDQSGYKYNTLPVSKNIEPCFFSFHLHTRNIPIHIVEQLKLYSPIGCRDIETYQNLKNHDIPCYISGCLTLTLPTRKNCPDERKVFFVDIPDSLRGYIPEELVKDGEFITHQPDFHRSSSEAFLTANEYDFIYRRAIDLLYRYKNEATLIVTTRLHVASPAIAMGIPVILVRSNVDGRFGCVASLTNIYTPSNFNAIDWEPECIDAEVEKKIMLDALKQCIDGPVSLNSDSIAKLNSYWKAKDNSSIDLELKNKFDLIISNIKNVQKPMCILLWGLTPETQKIKHIIDDYYPEFFIKKIVDVSCMGVFEGVQIIRPDELKKYSGSDCLVIVVAKAAHSQASTMLADLNIRFYLL